MTTIRFFSSLFFLLFMHFLLYFAMVEEPTESSPVHGESIPIYDTSELHERTTVIKKKEKHVGMYSSVFGGITLDPALMVIPMDDHMVHRGHGVFDTTRIVNGYLYEVDKHIERFLRSASHAKINTSPFPHATLKNILLQLVEASLCKNGSLRFYLSFWTWEFPAVTISVEVCSERKYHHV